MLRPTGSEKGHELDISKLLVDNHANTSILNQLVSVRNLFSLFHEIDGIHETNAICFGSQKAL